MFCKSCSIQYSPVNQPSYDTIEELNVDWNCGQFNPVHVRWCGIVVPLATAEWTSKIHLWCSLRLVDCINGASLATFAAYYCNHRAAWSTWSFVFSVAAGSDLVCFVCNHAMTVLDDLSLHVYGATCTHPIAVQLTYQSIDLLRPIFSKTAV